MPLISVITPFSRGIKELLTLLRDFRNQTFKDFEHVIVADGKVSSEIDTYIKKYQNIYNIKFCSINKDPGNMLIAPGTRPRNYGTKEASGEFVVYCDDDDRYKDAYLESFISQMSRKDMISIVQMSCQQSRMYKDGKPDHIVLIPEIGVPIPAVCHIGTPCFMVPRAWALENPWQHEPEHDFRFIKRIVDKHNPLISFKPGMQVDVDGLVIRGMRDFVSIPPFNRDFLYGKD